MEIFGAGDLETRAWYSDAPGSMAWKYGFDLNYKHWSKWRVTVTEENQKWLSPVPIEGDMMFPCVIQGQDGIFGALVNDPNSAYWYRKERKVVLRMYPNDQFAPLIKWDEVILPEETAA